MKTKSIEILILSKDFIFNLPQFLFLPRNHGEHRDSFPPNYSEYTTSEDTVRIIPSAYAIESVLQRKPKGLKEHRQGVKRSVTPAYKYNPIL